MDVLLLEDIVLEVLSALPVEQIFYLRRVCRTWYSVATAESTWKRLCSRDFNAKEMVAETWALSYRACMFSSYVELFG